MAQTSRSDVMTKRLYEHRYGTTRSGPVTLMPYDEASTRPGFISCFAFESQAQDHIRATGTTAGLRGMPLYTDLIYLDFDKDENDAADAEHILQKLGVGYELFSTGRAGRYHFHIPCDPISRVDLPFRVSAFVTQTFKGTDNSLYKTSGVIRTNGTSHHKAPGKFKHLIHTEAGKLVDIMRETKDVMPRVFSGIAGAADSDAADVLEALWVEPCFEGGRNRQVYRRAYLAKCAGKDLAEAEELLRVWNELMVHPPLRDGEVINTVRSAYRG